MIKLPGIFEDYLEKRFSGYSSKDKIIYLMDIEFHVTYYSECCAIWDGSIPGYARENFTLVEFEGG